VSVVPPRLTIIVPFHKGLGMLERALGALVPLRPGDELIVAADGAVDDCHTLASAHGARVIDIAGPRGPAVARNVAAAAASGDVLVFVDADVVASRDALERVRRIFAADPDLGAVFGAYDEDPGAPGFVSQYKNLAHAFIHRESGGPAQTFWAGFGAVRRAAYESADGFDERFERPSIEDIDLGYRLTAAGHRILLDPSLAVCHLKRWTLSGMIRSDVFDRGIPWTQLILRYGQFGSDLNVKNTYRLCVVVAYLTLASLLLSIFDTRLLWATALGLALLAYLSRDYYRFFLEKRGITFALRVFPLHVLYHLYNGFSFVAGTVLFFAARRLGVQLPGALPPYAPVTGAGRLGADTIDDGTRNRSSSLATTPDV
jgi:glycosyltransferase involved in cell wall biosynthesis